MMELFCQKEAKKATGLVSEKRHRQRQRKGRCVEMPSSSIQS